MKKKSLKQLVTKFNTEKPDFTGILPYLTGESESDLEDFTGNLIGKYNAIKTLWQISQPEKPSSRSRVWQSANGYIYLISWSNAALLRVLGLKYIYWLKSKGGYRKLQEFRRQISPKTLDRLESQSWGFLRSVVANIEEGFAQATTSRYLEYLGYVQGSLKEGKGEFQRLRQDNLLSSIPGSNLGNLKINLRDWHEALKKSVISSKVPPLSSEEFERKLKELKSSKFPLKPSKGHYRILKEFSFDYHPVDNLDPSKLTYEMFIELTNKTDWHLRRLVEALEKKLNDDKKGYQIEKARIKDKLKKK